MIIGRSTEYHSFLQDSPLLNLSQKLCPTPFTLPTEISKFGPPPLFMVPLFD